MPMKSEDTKVGEASTPAADPAPSSKAYQEKYYPLAPQALNKYDPFSVQAAIDNELLDVSAAPPSP